MDNSEKLSLFRKESSDSNGFYDVEIDNSEEYDFIASNKGGFAVSGRSNARIASPSNKGGFAVSGRTVIAMIPSNKGGFAVSGRSNARIASPSNKGGFAVSGRTIIAMAPGGSHNSTRSNVQRNY